MLYHFLYSLSLEASQFSVFNVFRYITTRSFIAFVLSFLVAVIIGKKFINWVKNLQFGQVVRKEGPKTHYAKGGTPTMGGLFILGSALLGILICGRFDNWAVVFAIILFVGYGFIGFFDDYAKITRNSSAGMSGKGKLFWQFSIAIAVQLILIQLGVLTTEIYVPFYKHAVTDLGYWYVLFGSLVIVGSSNAVNLTDGLDGLAIGPVITSCAALCFLCYSGGHSEISEYLLIPHIRGLGELTVFGAAIIGSSMGFLWYNTHPAQVFMGDIGSLSLGGLLGYFAVLSKNEFLFVIIGGIFVIEALSVIIQVLSFKRTGKRVFRMAPIHHHFELLGWKEPKVIVRFWIASILFAILAMATLKMR